MRRKRWLSPANTGGGGGGVMEVISNIPMLTIILVGARFALTVIIQQMLQVPIAGSVPLFVGAAALHLFAAASIGIFLGTLARSMPHQVQNIMLLAMLGVGSIFFFTLALPRFRKSVTQTKV